MFFYYSTDHFRILLFDSLTSNMRLNWVNSIKFDSQSGRFRNLLITNNCSGNLNVKKSNCTKFMFMLPNTNCNLQAHG